MSVTRVRAHTKISALVVVLAVLMLGLSVSASAAPLAYKTKSGPVINANFPDPDILKVGKVYHAYATNSGGANVQHRTSRDLVHWTRQPDVAPVLGDWVSKTCTFEPGGATDRCVWAPEVSKVGHNYVLYYAARDAASDKQCIGVSTASTPYGPFTPVGTNPLVCPTAQGGAIDPSTYAENGKLYLLWKADGNCCNLPAVIYLQPLSADGRTLTGPATPLIHNDQLFEGAVVEAPTLIKHNGTYVLFYSSNVFSGGNYKTGYATSTSLSGPYTKAREPLMTTDLFRGKVIGPGGQDVIVGPDGGWKIVFHGWDPTYSYRAMYVRNLTWSGGLPHVQGTSTRYEAEDGTIVDAHVVADDTASAGAKVGGLDHPDSSVTLTVKSAKAGKVTLGVWFGNGSLDPSGYKVKSSDTVTVNNRSAGIIVFPHTTWQNWTRANLTVHLKKGANKVTFTKRTFFTELDAVDVP